jgi:UDP-N-acetylglucosamine--N-acetylmuramyl-(pentapeptide) pyrophosphoryl-undecaprenol N-acetylglucosamine transferase
LQLLKPGGHVYPAIEVGKKLLLKGNKVFFIGNGSQIEKNALKGLDFEYKEINIDGVRGKSLFNKIFSSINIISRIFTIRKFIKKNKIKAMIGIRRIYHCPNWNCIINIWCESFHSGAKFSNGVSK